MTALSQRNLKDALTGNDFLAENGGGRLSPQQFDHFFAKTVKESKLLADIHTEYMDAPEKEISIMNIGGRILHKVTSGTPLSDNKKFKPGTLTRTLNSKLMKAVINITDDTFEDQIARGTLDTFLLDLATKQVGVDMEETSMLGDTQSIDEDTSVMDGFLVQVPVGQTIDWSNDPQVVSRDMFSAGLYALQPQFKRDKANMRFYVSSNTWQGYCDAIAEKNTPLADTYITSAPAQLPFYGVQFFILDTMPDDSYLLAHKDNLCVGIQRKVTVEKWRNPDYDGTNYYITVRFDAKILDTDGVVLYKGIKPVVNHTS